MVDKVIIRNKQISVRPATVITEEMAYGTSTRLFTKLIKFSFLTKYLFEPLIIPTVSSQTFLVKLASILDQVALTGVIEVQDGEWGTGAQHLKVGRLNWTLLKPLFYVLPISIKDRIWTVLDLNGYGDNTHR